MDYMRFYSEGTTISKCYRVNSTLKGRLGLLLKYVINVLFATTPEGP
jgi:hypothetical protein